MHAVATACALLVLRGDLQALGVVAGALLVWRARQNDSLFVVCSVPHAQNVSPAEDDRHYRPNQGEYMHQSRIVRWFVHAVALRVALTGALHLGRGTTKLTDLDAKAIGEALKTNETVTHVDLSGEE